MKILMIGHSYVVGLNRRLCREIARSGGEHVEVVVAAPKFVRGDLRPIRLETVEDEPYELVGLRTYLTGVPHIMYYGLDLRRLLARPWDVVHAWTEPYVLSASQIALLKNKHSKLIFSTFQNINKSYPPPFDSLERYAMSRSAGWTAFGRTIEETLRDRRGYRDRPHALIPSGVDVDAFHPDPEARTEVLRILDWSLEGPPIVGYLGRFVPEKGLPMLMRVLDRLSVDHRVLFVGSGSLESTLRAWGETRGDRVRVVTGVKHNESPRYLNAMDLLVAPSQTTPKWREQFGRMLIEAMASGAAIVASDSGEIPHVVGDAGVIVPESDESAWAETLNRLIESKNERLSLIDTGLERVRERFAWPVVARAFLDFFTEIVGSKSAEVADEFPVDQRS